MKSKINKADSQCHPHKIHNLPLKPFTAVKVKPKHSVFYLLQCLKYEPGSLTRARVRRIYLLSCQSFSQLLLLYSFLFHLSILFLTFYFRVQFSHALICNTFPFILISIIHHYQRIFKTPVRNFISVRTTARNAFATASSISPSFR